MRADHEKVQVWVLWRAAPVQVLLLQTVAERGAFWQPVTGGMNPGESPLEAAARELSEETGIERKQLLNEDLIFTEETFEFDSRWGGRAREYPYYGWIENSESGKAPSVKLSEKEHQAYRWVPLREALERLEFQSNRNVLKKIVQGFSKAVEKKI